ncbi:hypothetical protein C4D60_Mb03t02860 [Musa balbisiana]|uniref:Uncharacterized protein n=1 Tax=Musa balbisiana TaxID=52838 RepID=A0A4V4H5U5_MUSBA|nr:hypothetical protein C4D60_Mb03t02860 [Musa balbisiana]
MTEEWMVEAELSPATRDGGSSISEENAQRQGHCAPVSGEEGSGGGDATQEGTPKRAPLSPTMGRPPKKMKTLVRRTPSDPAVGTSAMSGLPGVTSQGEGSGSVKGKGSARSFCGDPSRRVPARPTLIRELCRVYSRAEGEQIQALNMADLPAGESGTPYITRWVTFKADNHIWSDGPTAQEFIRGALLPAIAKDLSCSSEMLAERATKSLVRGQHYGMTLIDRVLDVERLRARGEPEVIAAAEERALSLGEEVGCLKANLEESRSHIRSLDDELLTLSHDVETAKSLAWAAEEVLKEKQLVLPNKVGEAIVAYKASTGFERGLVRSGRVTYEFGYRVACARFQTKYQDLELESDPFADHPADQDGATTPGR